MISSSSSSSSSSSLVRRSASRLRTSVTDLLGIDAPIMCGGMHYVSYAELVAAVSNAGAIGFLTAVTQPTPEKLREEIRRTRAMTSKPFGVNLSFLPAAKPPDYMSYIRVIIDEGIKVVETAGNNPGKYIEVLKKGGITVIHKCVTVRHAKTALRHGADIISVDGFECAGHPGMDDVGLMLLLPIFRRALPGVPLIASGGIGDGSQLAACIALGAGAVNMGTRFMATKEAPIHSNIKRTLVESDQTQTTLILKTLKNTERVFKNDMALKAQAAERAKPGDIGVIREYIAGSKYRKSFHETGDTTDSVWSCGQVIGIIDDVPSVQELVSRIVGEASSIAQSTLPGAVAARL